VKIRYVGPHESVEIAATRQTVENGETVDVPAAVGRSLVKQASWKKVTEKKKEPSDG
jgi:hypothetical protein